MKQVREQRMFAVIANGRVIPSSVRGVATRCRRDAYLWLQAGLRNTHTTAEIWQIARKKYGFRVIPVLVRPE